MDNSDNYDETDRRTYEFDEFDEGFEVGQAPQKRRKKRVTEDRAFFKKASVFLFCSSVFLLPFIFIPISGFSVDSSKVLITALLVCLSGLSFIYSKQYSGLSIPVSFFSILGGLFTLIVLSTVFSESFNTSFVHRLQTGTFFVTSLGIIMAFLAPLIISTSKHFVLFFGSFLGGVGMVSLIHALRLILGPSTLKLGVLTMPTSTPVGSWHDLALLFGIVYIIALAGLVLSSLPRLVNAILTGALLLSLVGLTVVHFTTLLSILLILTAIVLLYSLKEKAAEGRARVIAPLVILTLLLIFSGQIQTLTGRLFNTGYAEVHPSWQSTLELVKENSMNPKMLLMGGGPNTFSNIWQDDRSVEVVESEYWNVNFSSGTSTLATYLLTLGALFVLCLLMFFGYIVQLASTSEKPQQGTAFYQTVRRVSAFAALLILLYGAVYVFGTVHLLLFFVFSGVAVAAHVAMGRARVSTLSFSAENGPYLYGTLMLIFVASLVLILATTVSRVLYGQAVNESQSIDELTDFDSIDAKLSLATLFERNDEIQRARAELALLEMRTVLQLGEEEITEEVQKRFGDALERTQTATGTATAIDPRNYLNWVTKGFIFESLGMFEIENAYKTAESSYAQALLEYPTNPEILLMLSRLGFVQGDLVAAREYAREAVEIKKSYAGAYALLAQIEIEDNNTNRAILVLEEAVLANPMSSTLNYELGSLYYNEGEYEDAVEAYDRAIAADPQYANALYFRGLSHLRTGDTDAALADLQKVLLNNETNQDLARVISNIEAGRAPFLGVNQGEGSLLPQNSTRFEDGGALEEANTDSDPLGPENNAESGGEESMENGDIGPGGRPLGDVEESENTLE